MSTERTLVLVKPDGVARNLSGAILSRIEAKGYVLADLKLVQAGRDQLEAHYAEHLGKRFTSCCSNSCSPGRSSRQFSKASGSSRGSVPWPGPLIRRSPLRARSAAISAVTGDRKCSRTSCTVQIRWNPQNAKSRSGFETIRRCIFSIRMMFWQQKCHRKAEDASSPECGSMTL